MGLDEICMVPGGGWGGMWGGSKDLEENRAKDFLGFYN